MFPQKAPLTNRSAAHGPSSAAISNLGLSLSLAVLAPDPIHGSPVTLGIL